MPIKRDAKGHFIKGAYVGFGFKKEQKPWNKGVKGIHLSPESEFKKGDAPWNKGLRDEQTNTWKGDDVGYDGLHSWVERYLGKPKQCDFCGSKKDRIYHWSNKNHEYKRVLSDWQRLCIRCHFHYDREKFGARRSFKRKYY